MPYSEGGLSDGAALPVIPALTRTPAPRRSPAPWPCPPPQADGTLDVFFEETSLVGRDERRLEFPLLKRRLLKRLEFHGIEFDPESVREEEYCYIPMGGALPDPEQRIVPFGGAANTVHPATGYQLCRMLCSSTDVARALTTELRRPLHLPYISPTSPLYLPYISPISPLYLRCISDALRGDRPQDGARGPLHTAVPLPGFAPQP